ncbi:protein-disulfide reductase DsbD domain-containing protein [Algicella marina]|nr:protein-disulfide reductase DsbD domain-containing protein [Algicella marina]
MIRLIALMAALVAPTVATSQEMSRMRLLPGWEMPDGNRMIGVEIDLDPGWKTYWRAPGAGGIPPMFDWTGSQNLAAATIHWPRPEVQESYGMTTLGYSDRVVFPVELTPQTPGGPIDVALALSYGVCEDICIPAHATAEMPAESAADSTTVQAIENALAARPLTTDGAGIQSASCQQSAETVTASFRFAGEAPAAPFSVFETGSEETFLTPVSTQADGYALTITAALDHYGKGAPDVDLGNLRITLLTADSAIDIRGCPAG